MNIKHKAFLWVSLVIVLLSSFLLHEGITHFNQEIDLEIQGQEKVIDGVTREIIKDAYDPYLYKINHFVQANSQIREAFADGDRERLLELCLPHYRYYQGENKYFHAMDFNLPDGTVFLRVQKPSLFGDNIGETRPIVSTVHRMHHQRSGFDVGKHGAIFWVAHPVKHNGKYLGAVEFGIEVKQLEEALASSFSCEVSSVLQGNAWQKAELVKHGFQEHGDYILMTRGDTLFDQVTRNLNFTIDDQWVKIGDKQYILHSCAHLKNFTNQDVGKLIMFQDITPFAEKKKDFVRHVVLLTIVALLLAFFVLYYSIGGLIGRLEQYALENKQAKNDLQLAHENLEDRVKTRTVELAKANVRLEDEVTIRKRAEDKLNEQRQFLMTLVESLSHPLYVIDAEAYQIVLANKAAYAITGKDSFRGMTCYKMTHHREEPCKGADHPCPLLEVKKTGKPVQVEHIHYDEQENKRYFEIHAYPMFDANKNLTHIIEYNFDVTEQKTAAQEKEKLQSQLIASQKMEAVGFLAGGVAHDFNNILTTILGYSQIMAMKLEDDDPMRDKVEEIYDAAERGSALTQQLLAFSRKQVMELKVVNLNTIVENIAKMLQRLIGEDVAMDIVLGESVGNVKVDIGQVEQVIMNLVINARDAMPDGGQLTISTDRVELDEEYTSTHLDVEPGPHNVLSVTDTGKGISKEIQEKIFEPFYTTKKRGKGTGLGLATVYGIVHQHKGHIYVYSEEGRGTTFKIYLPSEKAEVEEIIKKEATAGKMSSGDEAVMIVDDDDAIRRLIRDTLEPLGYDILEAGSGEDAVAVMDRAEKPIDLVLTDLIMPGMNGQELIGALQQKNPEIRAILMSGYTDDMIDRQGGLKAGTDFINKPLLPISLANKIREVLDRSKE